MFEIDFSGWFECRLPTDPDEFDHPRGASGWTFALPGEPDLDRVIRFQNPTVTRSHGPVARVSATHVRSAGRDVPSHPMVGAEVELLDGAKFEGRNGDIAPSAQEPIVPFSLRFRAGDAAITGRDPVDLGDPAEIARRQPIAFAGDSGEVAAATGITDRAAYRRERKALLEADLAVETDPVRRDAMAKRISELGRGSIRLTSLGFQLTYQFDLRGPNEWRDPGGALGYTPPPGATWSVHFWAGGWDADALCGFLKGTLRIA